MVNDMVDIVLTWDLKNDIESVKKLVSHNKEEVLKDWYGRDNYNNLVQRHSENGAKNWVEDSFIDSIDNLIDLLQTITNETKDNPLVQRRLKAVGFTPRSIT